MKKLLYILLGLVVIYLILALFGKSSVKVERQVTVNKSADVIKKQMSDLKFFHDKWSPWTEKDPKMTTNYAGNAGEVGHKMDWKSEMKEVGQGTMAIIAMPGDSIIMDLSFEGMGTSKAYYVVSGKDNSSSVTWGLEMKIGFFARPMMMFMNMDKMIGPDFEKGLGNLKTALEEMKDEASATAYQVSEVEWPEVTFAGTKKEMVKFENIATFFGKNFATIGQDLQKGNIKPEGAPSGLYTKYDESKGEAELAAVWKVAKGTKIKGWESYTYPASKVLHVVYYGDYAKSKVAHDAIGAYMKEKGLTEMNAVVEEYVTDPMTEKDTAKWQTNIYYILK